MVGGKPQPSRGAQDTGQPEAGVRGGDPPHQNQQRQDPQPDDRHGGRRDRTRHDERTGPVLRAGNAARAGHAALVTRRSGAPPSIGGHGSAPRRSGHPAQSGNAAATSSGATPTTTTPEPPA